MKRMHNAWMRAVAGRLEMRYRYSKDIVYNNFVWPEGSGGDSLDRINRIDRIEESGVVGRDDPIAPRTVGRISPERSSPCEARSLEGCVPDASLNPVNPVNPVETDSPRSPDLHVKISAAAQSVLDARAHYPGSSLADLYDPLTMPPELVKAHAHLDALVDRAYGLSPSCTDAERVAHLFALYARP